MNKPKSSYIAENIDLLANLTWKELETIYYLPIPSVKDYSKTSSNIPVSKSEDKSTQTSEKQRIKSDVKLKSETEKTLAQPVGETDSPAEPISPAVGTAFSTSSPSGIPTPELGIAKSIQKHMKDHVSTSPFAKLKSNSPTMGQGTSLQAEGGNQEHGLAYPSTSPTPTPVIRKVSQPTQPVKESDMESAWFIEPDRADTAVSTKKESTEADQKPIADQLSAETQAAKSTPKESPAISLDTAVEDAFGRMLSSPKKKISQSDTLSKLPELTSPDPKLLPYSTPASEPESKPEITTSPIESSSVSTPPAFAFDFSPALKTEDRNRQLHPLSVAPPQARLPLSHPRITLMNLDTYVSRDVLQNLIQNHIKHASGQGADFGQGQSIGTGKEYEVWLNNPARSKFIGGSKANEPANPVKNSGSFVPRVVPADIRKSCLILGLRPENLSYETVQDAWKKSIALPGVHPDQGGDTEMAVYLNTAKDILVRWLDAQAPKLGKKFGAPKKDDTKQ